MKAKITGIISFLIAIIAIVVSFIVIINQDRIDNDECIVSTLIILISINILLYVIWTRFGYSKSHELEKIENENLMIQRKIEQKELLKKLEELNS